MQKYNISNAEQLVGACATPEGFNGIMRALGLTKNKLNEFLYQVKRQLPSEQAELLSKPVPVPPLGARKPRKKKKNAPQRS